jgi:hypothetical protein
MGKCLFNLILLHSFTNPEELGRTAARKIAAGSLVVVGEQNSLASVAQSAIQDY